MQIITAYKSHHYVLKLWSHWSIWSFNIILLLASTKKLTPFFKTIWNFKNSSKQCKCELLFSSYTHHSHLVSDISGWGPPFYTHPSVPNPSTQSHCHLRERVKTNACSVTLSCLTVTPWTAAHQDPLSMGFLRQEYWNGLPFPPPGDLPNSGTEPTSLASPALAGGFLPTVTPGKPKNKCHLHKTTQLYMLISMSQLATPNLLIRSTATFHSPQNCGAFPFISEHAIQMLLEQKLYGPVSVFLAWRLSPKLYRLHSKTHHQWPDEWPIVINYMSCSWILETNQSLTGHIICKYFLPFCGLSFHFVYGILCCAKGFGFN